MGGPVRWWCSVVVFHVSETDCKVTKNKRHPQPQKIFFLLFFRCIVIRKTNDKSKTTEHPKSKNKFAYIIRYQKKLQKISKKICRVNFLLYLCTSETKNNREDENKFLHDP